MIKRNIYYAKSKLADGHQPTVKEHLEKVSIVAGRYGKDIGCEKEARLAGQLHDFGKYSAAFQKKLEVKSGASIDHAICGATLLAKSVPGKRQNSQYKHVIEVINGHHGELREFSEIQPVLAANLRNEEPVEQNGKFSALSGYGQYGEAQKAFLKDFPGFKIPSLQCEKTQIPDQFNETMAKVNDMLLARMLFSCVVDADYSVSACDENPEYLKETDGMELNPDMALKTLYAYREQIRSSSQADQKLNMLRDYVFDKCGEAGEKEIPGLFTLTAPTGVGKTLALLHFALKQCIKTGKKRIIIVLPFLTLTEQNADTYRKIIPNLLEDHSQKGLDDRERQFAARWSAPFIITTSVRFFETLFSCRPTDCRKMHHIANSVVIFDEAQSLPVDVTTCTLQAVNELCRRYGCTMVFSTATQPDFAAIDKLVWKPREIVPDHERLYKTLARTDVEWRIEQRTGLREIAEEIKDFRSVCVIVNLRKHARKLFKYVKELCASDEVYYLTTDLCMEHRREIVGCIKKRLDNGLPCRVVATQCIEAGVDLDFKKMYRALGPLDSIIQAAGRCNRNGRMAEKGDVVVFVPDEDGNIYPGTWYEHASQKVAFLLKKHFIDIHNPFHIGEYYRLVYESLSDKHTLVNAIKNKDYREVDREYQLIREQGFKVIVPCKNCEKLFEEVRNKVIDHGLTPQLMRQAANITVTVSKGAGKNLETIAERIPYSEKGRRGEDYSEYWILRQSSEKIYKDDMGLQIYDENSDIDPFW